MAAWSAGGQLGHATRANLLRSRWVAKRGQVAGKVVEDGYEPGINVVIAIGNGMPQGMDLVEPQVWQRLGPVQPVRVRGAGGLARQTERPATGLKDQPPSAAEYGT